MTKIIRVAISTCPNDTFAFSALMERLIEVQGLEFEFTLMDIQQLNQHLLQEDFDIIKASFAAAARISNRYWVLPSGSALGFGVGPLLLAARSDSTPRTIDQLTLCPGEHTTAAMLFKTFYANTTNVEHTLFSDIMPRLQSANADFGVCIHEGRFTWQSEGLHLVEDLGERWESSTQCPLPLGGIFASRALAPDTVAQVQSALFESIKYAQTHTAAALPIMRRYAQEFDDRVLMQHVDLYVNDWTVDLGSLGRRALNELSKHARGTGEFAVFDNYQL